ncbi:MAG: 23S rRNA (adenine(2503)-C(2))-methyltransferase RlmN [Holosporales bacterium]|jgi:23S rRNA (adenine2503-C2)-methyltransferase|nr:23S rRNA (adenine(2503)-C(2))-methyltransferase RlmN [Holosporales bacterium]
MTEVITTGINLTKCGVLNCSASELKIAFKDAGIPTFRADQVLEWVYRFGKTSFYNMTNIGKSLQKQLDEMFYIHRPQIVDVASSSDGTKKFLLKLTDAATVECVYIPDTKRKTICVSSQVGCNVGCKFCNTGYSGLVRNLTAEEIVSQFLIVKDYMDMWNCDDRLSNVVFMGMGEPLLNYQNVLCAIDNMMLDGEAGLSRRKITLSTSGISPVIRKIAKDLPCRLAISLHAPNDEIRSSIMPINDIYNIGSIVAACEEYSAHHKFLKITFEYLLLGDVNDSRECAAELLNLLRPLHAKVNLLRFNEWDGCGFNASPGLKVREFASVLDDGGLEVSIRTRRGADIMAACGQLNANSNSHRVV